MGCSIPEIPKYLHFSEGQKEYKPKDFNSYHLLFRTGFKERENPIEFPQIITAFSVCWSKLVDVGDVLPVVKSNAPNPESKGNHVFFGKIYRLRKLKVAGHYINSKEFPGRHIVTTEIVHSPLPCNYSHAEILVKHIYKDKLETKVDVITYDQWKNKKCLLRKNGHKEFFQPLINAYKAKLLTNLNTDIDELSTPWYLRLLSKHFIVRLSIWWTMTVRDRSVE